MAQMNHTISGRRHAVHPVGVGQLVPRLEADPRDRPLRRRRLDHGARRRWPSASRRSTRRERLRRSDLDERRPDACRRSRAAVPRRRDRGAPAAAARHHRRGPPDAAVGLVDDHQGGGRSSCSTRPSPACPRSSAPPAGCSRSARSTSPGCATRATRSSSRPATRAERMVQRTEVVKAAEQRAHQIVDAAEAEARRLRHEGEDFCDQKLASFEIVLERTLKLVASGRAEAAGHQPAGRGRRGRRGTADAARR